MGIFYDNPNYIWRSYKTTAPFLHKLVIAANDAKENAKSYVKGKVTDFVKGKYAKY